MKHRWSLDDQTRCVRVERPAPRGFPPGHNEGSDNDDGEDGDIYQADNLDIVQDGGTTGVDKLVTRANSYVLAPGTGIEELPFADFVLVSLATWIVPRCISTTDVFAAPKASTR